ncbi:uncharacterized protein LOC121395456 isoform X1 [Xenopus laevis]|uniref:Uncharacterized protein LOC121395456 isoform X1 n=1 Tax=Xenopus laevis TaxID=8355 RepID=A0A8J1L5X3_XENLA|nr:uncharacterized protein LOC121395456 isoform X1 [Xenopus laevis]
MDVLNQISEIQTDSNTLLITLDVESLYTSISHQLGLEALKYFLYSYLGESDETSFLIKMMGFILHFNYFTFQGKFYLQTQGTAMGTSCAPSYANLFLGHWEETVVNSQMFKNYHNKILRWIRYIDDILILWSGTEQEALEFIDKLNINKLNIKLTVNISKQMVSFLDLSIMITEEGKLTTDNYRKETATNSLLSFSSHHPYSVKKSLPIGEFLRLKRNCSSHVLFKEQAVLLKNRLKQRGYSGKLIKRAYHRALGTEREQLLHPKTRSQQDNTVRFITTYNSNSKKINQIINKHWSVLKEDTVLDTVLQDTVSVCYRRSPNLKDLLSRSHFQTPSRPNIIKGCFPCRNCNMCDHMIKSTKFSDRFNINHTIKDYINCRTKGVIYVLECPCKKQYVGMTTQMLKLRIQQHCSSIRNADKIGKSDKILSTVASHFKQYHNMNPSNVKFWAIEQIQLGIRGGDLEQELLKRETHWIFKLNSVSPNGINENILFNAFL